MLAYASSAVLCCAAATSCTSTHSPLCLRRRRVRVWLSRGRSGLHGRVLGVGVEMVVLERILLVLLCLLVSRGCPV